MAMKNSLEFGMMHTSPRFTSGAPSGSNQEQAVEGVGGGGGTRVAERATGRLCRYVASLHFRGHQSRAV